MRFCLLLLCLLFCCTSATVSAKESSKKARNAVEMKYHWVQFEKGSRMVARAVVQNNSPCPTVSLDAELVQMKERRNVHYKSEFPVKVCQVFFGPEIRKVTFSDNSNIIVPKTTNAMAIIGDSGCRGTVQNCHDIKAYPAPAIAQSLSEHTEVDFVIHVGDIIYNYFGPKHDKSSGFPYGDKWEVAEFEFFKPFEPILRTKPILIARGNHDACVVGAGKMWSVLFDVETEHVSKCREMLPPYFVDIVDTRFLMFDSSPLNESQVFHTPAMLSEAITNMKTIHKFMSTSDQENILVTHRPFVAVVTTGYIEDRHGKINGCGFVDSGYLVRSIMLEAGAADSSLGLVISGHQHNGELISFAKSSLPLQIVVGISGAELRKTLYDSPSEIIGCHVYSVGNSRNVLANARLTNSVGDRQNVISNAHFTNSHGFALIERASRGSKKITYYDPEDKIVSRCDINGRQFLCE